MIAPRSVYAEDIEVGLQLLISAIQLANILQYSLLFAFLCTDLTPRTAHRTDPLFRKYDHMTYYDNMHSHQKRHEAPYTSFPSPIHYRRWLKISSRIPRRAILSRRGMVTAVASRNRSPMR